MAKPRTTEELLECKGLCGIRSAKECSKCGSRLLHKVAGLRADATTSYGLPVERPTVEFVPLSREVMQMPDPHPELFEPDEILRETFSPFPYLPEAELA